MLHKPYKIITQDNGTLKIYGNNHLKELIYTWPDWIDEKTEDNQEPGFWYKGELYFLSEFERIGLYTPDWLKEFDGIHNDSFFSGILIKLVEDENAYNDLCVKVYTFIG